MKFGEKLQELRKQKGLSQEALAQELSVSRQSVSKWENNETYPEMDKLIKISDLFQVSLDYLIKENDEEVKQERSKKYFMSSQHIEEYIQYKNNFINKIALSVMMIILSVNFPIMFSKPNKEAIGVVVMLVIIALAVTILITTGISSEEYNQLEKKEIWMSYNDLQIYQEQYVRFKSKFGLAIGLGVCLILFSLALVVLISEYVNEDSLLAPIQFLVCIAVAVFCFIRVGLKDEMYRFLVQNERYIQKKNEEDSNLFGITMPLAAMLYLFIGFTKNWWHPGWIIFPVVAIITLAIENRRSS